MNLQTSCMPQDACLRSVTKSIKALKIAAEGAEEIVWNLTAFLISTAGFFFYLSPLLERV